MHVAACGHCRAIVLDARRSAGEQRPGRRTRASLVAALILVSTALMLYGPASWRTRIAVSAMSDVAAASAELRYRPSAGRLSLDAPFREVKPVQRGGEAQGASPLVQAKLWALVARLHEQGETSPTPSNLHALGVSCLLIGDTAQAVQSLEQAIRAGTGGHDRITAVIRRSTDATLLNDLAVAYLTLTESEGELRWKPLALEAAERAWELERTPQIAWTRAVVMDSFHIREPSISAWRAYLALDASSQWSDSARRRLHELEEPTDAERWPSIRSRLLGGDERLLQENAGRYRQDVRLWCEDELLPAWGEAVLAGDPSATERLDALTRVAAALERVGAEPDVARAVAAIRNASQSSIRALARGHAAYGAARLADRQSHPRRALQELDVAVAMLTPERTPFAWRARIERAGALYLSNAYDRARGELQRLPRGEGSPLSASCEGKAEALLGIIALQTGSYEEAARHYRRGVEAFRRAGEKGFEATLTSRLAAALELSGEFAQAQSHREQALQMLDRTGERRQRHDALIEAAYVAIGNGQDAAANLYLETLVAINTAAGDDARTCSALMWRSAYRHRSGRTGVAVEDLRTAQQACRSIADPAIRERALANLQLAEVAVSPNDSVGYAGLTEAIGYYTRTNSRVWLRTAYFHRARLLERFDPPAAERDFLAALAEIESTRGKIDERQARVSFTATADEIVDGYVEFLLRHKREREAFELADRSRLRELVDSPTARWPAPTADALLPHLQAELPFDTTLVAYRVLGTTVVAWIVSSGTFVTEILPLPLRDLHQSLESLHEEAPETVFVESASRLYDALIRRIERHIGGDAALVIVPDDELERVPYGALYDSVHRRFLLQTRATVIAPSAGLFVESRARARERGRGPERLLVVNADAGGGDMPALPAAAGETKSLARLYPDAQVVDGASMSATALLQRARDVSILQFVGHTVVEQERTLRTLRLGAAPHSRLGMADIVAASLPNLRLVYLSACETDAGPILKSEGSVTIARSFFAAGVPIVVGTLWPVADDVAQAAARTFHQHLRRGDTPAEALRQAQIALLNRKGRSGADWAAFRIIGAGI